MSSSRKERAQLIQKKLNQLYPDPKIPLKATSHYTLLIAVLLSARCTDARVNEVTPKLFAKAKTPQEMVQLSIKEIETIIRPCGLYKNKAKAIWNLSKKLIEEQNGKVPNTLKELEALPGVGHKTASVILCQAFKKPAFPVDTHIHRCAKRWKLSTGKNVQKTEKDLKALFPEKDWIKLHLQMIYFAREHCPARGHNKMQCPLCNKFSH
jgi:endonuclease-3